MLWELFTIAILLLVNSLHVWYTVATIHENLDWLLPNPAIVVLVLTLLCQFAIIDLELVYQYEYQRFLAIIMVAEMLVLDIDPFFTLFFHAMSSLFLFFTIPGMRLIRDAIAYPTG